MVEILIQDIQTYLVDKITIKGFTRERIDSLCANEMKGMQGYEIRFLLIWSGLYLYQFEELYNINIDYL